MQNGRDHAGVCNVVVSLPRRRPNARGPAEGVCLVDERLPDDMLVLVGSHLSAPSLLAAEQCSHRFLDVLRAAKVWTEPEPKPKHPTAEPNPDPNPQPQPPTPNPRPTQTLTPFPEPGGPCGLLLQRRPKALRGLVVVVVVVVVVPELL